MLRLWKKCFECDRKQEEGKNRGRFERKEK